MALGWEVLHHLLVTKELLQRHCMLENKDLPEDRVADLLH